MALIMLGAVPLASGADSPAAPDAIATRVQELLHQRYAARDRLAVIDRVFDIEKRIGAYRAARTKTSLIYRLNVDLCVATKDNRIRVQALSETAMAGAKRYDLGSGLALSMPAGKLLHEGVSRD
ncbi:hypothetical protein ACFONN_13630 [Dyella humi]|uniref:Uncharacterized protein n=1 Tax=Dyella humi TaxID=1770547 RepID=A0ABW8ILF9_9GAMM